MYNLLESLNAEQAMAAQHIDDALLILAGAGSGKTKTLTTRLAYLMSEVGVPAQNTLTLTFTNKAAKEMQQRALSLISNTGLAISTLPLLCTFHKFGLLFLQRYIQILKRGNNFNIIDEDDKKKILTNIKKSLYANIKNMPANSSILNFISESKNANILPDDEACKLANSQNIATQDKAIKIEMYKHYQEYLKAYNLIDFDDLLLLPYRILEMSAELREKISSHYQYIMVDEYQDTNDLQVLFLKQLCATHNNICVVGDDDQSIYGWRGANIRNILNFQKQFNAEKIIKLERNYRSTKQILSYANALISHNKDRYDKTLISTREGNNAELIKSENDIEEMQKIIAKIRDIVSNGGDYSDIAILFRLNPLSRNIERHFLDAKIPYQIIGTIRFYERQEIKDVLAYLRLGLNPDDDFSLERIVNKPKRGIGDKSWQEILLLAKPYRSIYDAFNNNAYFGKKYASKLAELFNIIDDIQACIKEGIFNIYDIFQLKIKLYHEEDMADKGGVSNAERRENIAEFFRYFRDYCDTNNVLLEKGEDILQEFLHNILLASSADMANGGGVSCMSIHNSKGLEFKHVFVIGMERGIFPLRDGVDYEYLDSDIEQQSNIAEERRLAYVAITRAKDNLFLSYVKKRYYRNKALDREPSQFLIESGVANIKDFDGFNVGAFYSIKKVEENYNDLNVGDCVRHKILGFGRIESLNGVGNNTWASVNFGGLRKNVVLSFLTKASD